MVLMGSTCVNKMNKVNIMKINNLIALLIIVCGLSYSSFATDTWQYVDNSKAGYDAYNTGVTIEFVQSHKFGNEVAVIVYCSDKRVYYFYPADNVTGLDQKGALACFLAAKSTSNKVNFFGDLDPNRQGVYKATDFIITNN
jgi:hypothetical protein